METQEELRVGDTAPDFTLPDERGEGRITPRQESHAGSEGEYRESSRATLSILTDCPRESMRVTNPLE
jgi:hypothetical protein